MKSADLLRFASGARRHTVGCLAKLSPKKLLLAVRVFKARQVFNTGGELGLHDLRPIQAWRLIAGAAEQSKRATAAR
ncbi:hypothetical protein IVA80_09405 [Bradyrhizobium sp. 139]|uniref:hypothetical protein n=1 Tax=Bradyrhizobium sp. 139 TaxID=2782616 RepID=UPI001FF7A5AF|nr:hypothetical protein [Bradyrhizobium sp. 139]MCK1741083.1 hypothetical protein [Bradyrhizobium sp. 139]